MKDLFILIEDDPQQSATITTAIEGRYRNALVELLETESEFCERVDKMALGEARPRMIISDVMLPWAFPEPNAPAVPHEVEQGTFREAGLRCWERFRKRPDLKTVPWIYFTVLDETTIDYEAHSDERTGYVQKAGSIEPLLQEIEEYLHLEDNWTETDEQVTQSLTASPKMRKILLEGLNTPLADCATSLP